MPATLLRSVPRITPKVARVTNGRGLLVWQPPSFYSTVAMLYGFPADTMGFAGGTGSTGSADTLSWETAAPLSGAGSLRVSRLWSSGSDFVTARTPDRPVGARDLRGGDADALGALLLVPAGTPGSDWRATVLVRNSAGTVVSTSAPLSLSVGVPRMVWAPVTQQALADVASVEWRVSANGVNGTHAVLLDTLSTGASGAQYPDEGTPGGLLWETTFSGADPKAALAVEPGTERDAGNLTFATVNGAQRARVAFPTVGSRWGWGAASRFTALGTVAQPQAILECGFVIPAAMMSSLSTLDLRVPSLGLLPEDQPGTYTSGEGVQQPDSASFRVHIKAGGSTSTGGGGVLLDEQFTTARTISGGSMSDPTWHVESGSNPMTMTGGIARQTTPSGGFGRIMSQDRYGGSGKTIEVRARMRATRVGGAVNASGNAIGWKFPAKTTVLGYDDDDPRSVYGRNDTSDDPGYMIVRHGVTEGGLVEAVGEGFGTDGSNFYTGGTSYTGKSPTSWRDVVVRTTWPTSAGGSFRFRVTIDGTLVREMTLPAPDSRYGNPGFLWFREDDADIEWDSVQVVDLAGGGTTTVAGVPWGEVSVYAHAAGGSSTPPDGYGFRFPLRPDLSTSSTGDRSSWWHPTADVETHLRAMATVNTPGVADGHLDLWMGGTQVLRLRDVMWRQAGQEALGWNQVLWDVLHPNGGTTVAGRYVDLTYLRLSTPAQATSAVAPGAPGAPVAGTVTSTSVALTWAAGSGATSHTLLRNGSVIASGLTTSYTDSGLSPSTAYSYSVRAVNSGGTATGPAATVTTAAGTVTQAYLASDDFASAFGAKWNSVPSNARIDAGRGALDYTTAYTRLLTPPVDWTGKASCVEWLSVPPDGARQDHSIRIDGSNNYEIVRFGSGTLRVQKTIGGVMSTPLNIPLDTTAHRWTRIRVVGSALVVDTSADGSAWTERHRETAEINVTVAREAIGAQAATGVTGTALFDNNNLPGTSAAPTTVAYVAPSARGTGSGDSLANAAGGLTSIPALVQNGARDVRLVADGTFAGATVSLTVGGSVSVPLQIHGVASDGTTAAEARILGTRVAPYDPAQADSGSPTFRLDGASYVTFTDLLFENVEEAITVRRPMSSLVVDRVRGRNVRRFVDNTTSDALVPATISGLTVRNFDVRGYSKSVVRLRYGTHDFLIENGYGDSERQDGDAFAMGVFLDQADGGCHDGIVRDVRMDNNIQTDITPGVTATDYWNGDGFVSEEPTYNVRFERCGGAYATDGIFDLKGRVAERDDADNVVPGTGSGIVLVDCWGARAKRILRFHDVTDAVVERFAAHDPVREGGSSSSECLWMGANTGVTLIDCELSSQLNDNKLIEQEANSRVTVQGGILRRRSTGTERAVTGSPTTYTKDADVQVLVVDGPAYTIPAGGVTWDGVDPGTSSRQTMAQLLNTAGPHVLAHRIGGADVEIDGALSSMASFASYTPHPIWDDGGDVHVGADGSLLAAHDQDLSAFMTPGGNVNDQTLASWAAQRYYAWPFYRGTTTSEAPPTLAQILAKADELQIDSLWTEVKEAGGDPVPEILASGMADHMLVGSFTPSDLVSARQAGIPVGYWLSEARHPADPATVLTAVDGGPPDVVGYNFEQTGTFTTAYLKVLHDAGIKLHPYTMHRRRDLSLEVARLAAAGMTIWVCSSDNPVYMAGNLPQRTSDRFAEIAAAVSGYEHGLHASTRSQQIPEIRSTGRLHFTATGSQWALMGWATGKTETRPPRRVRLEITWEGLDSTTSRWVGVSFGCLDDYPFHDGNSASPGGSDGQTGDGIKFAVRQNGGSYLNRIQDGVSSAPAGPDLAAGTSPAITSVGAKEFIEFGVNDSGFAYGTRIGTDGSTVTMTTSSPVDLGTVGPYWHVGKFGSSGIAFSLRVLEIVR